MKKQFLGTTDSRAPYLMLAFGVAGVLFVNIFPSVKAVWMSFFENGYSENQRFVWFVNFGKIFRMREFWQVLGNTLFWSLATLALSTVLGILAAVLLNRNMAGKGLFRTLLMIPWATPPVVSSMVWKTLFNDTLSPINDVLIRLGLRTSGISFLGNPTWQFGPITLPMLSLLVVNVWNVFPFIMVMVLAAMQSVDTSCYEAATIDGASKMRQFFSITIPLILPVLSISLLLQGIWQFNSFNFNYLMTNGGPLNTTKTMSVMIYQKAFSEFDYGQAGAISAMMLCCVLIPAAIYIRYQIRNLEK